MNIQLSAIGIKRGEIMAVAMRLNIELEEAPINVINVRPLCQISADPRVKMYVPELSGIGKFLDVCA